MYESLVKSGHTFEYADEFEKLLLLCTQHNRCYFDGKTYLMPDGLPMGGPLSFLMANVFMNRLEIWALKFARFASHALLWHRYVDDILCFWTGTDSELTSFLEDLNGFDPQLSFSSQIAGHNANYLDISISLKADNINDNLVSPEYSIFRKPQFTGVSISNRSLHPTCHKLATIHSAIS